MNLSELHHLQAKVAELEHELMLLAAKRLLKPNIAYAKRMEVIMHELYTLTNNDKYRL